MTHRFQGLNQTAHAAAAGAGELQDGIYLVRVERAEYRWHARKPFYLLRLSVQEPLAFAGQVISGGMYCSAKALWRLGWFLRDFGYDTELLNRDEVDEKAIVGLCGVVKISQTVVHGTSLLNFDGFAPSRRWLELSPAAASPVSPVIAVSEAPR
jgi:hypothetical protein